MDDTDLGTLTRQGDGWTLTFTRKLAHPREKVWRAVTEPEHLAAWFPQKIVGERRAGGKMRVGSEEDDGFDGGMGGVGPPSGMGVGWGGDRPRLELRPHGGGTGVTVADTFARLG